MGANTTAYAYLDTPTLSKVCEKELAKIKKACGPKDPKKKSMSENLMGEKATKKLEKIKEQIAKKGGAPQWLMDHCDGLWFKPVSPKVSSEINELTEGLKNLDAGKLGAEVKAHIGEIVKALDDFILEVAKDAAIKTGAKAGARTLAGSIFGPIGAILVQVVNVVDTAITAVEVGGQILDLKDEIKSIRDVLNGLPNQLKQIAQDARDNPQKAMADAMSLIWRLDACTRARRCQLVPYQDTHHGTVSKDCDGQAEDKEETEISGPASGQGCCPGQTGHHVLPGSMFKACGDYKNIAKGCAHQNAPTICVEGVNNSHGSHGQMHKQLEEQMDEYPSGTISKDDAIKEAVKSVKKVFPESGCSAKCLKAQLEKYYEKFNCPKIIASDGTGGQTGRGNE